MTKNVPKALKTSFQNDEVSFKGIGSILFLNKRPMGHIAHLNNTGSYENTFRKLIYISFPFAPPDP
jgi:hypothetical protein